MPVKRVGGEAEQLTDSKSSVSAFLPSPDGAWIAYVQADAPTAAEEKAKREKVDVHVVDETFKMSRLWVIPTAKNAQGKREARLLTAGDYTVDNRFDWSPDGKV